MTSPKAPNCKGCGEPLKCWPLYCPSCRNIKVYDGYTREQLSDAFDQVGDLTNWKLPIDHTFRGFLSEPEFRLFDAAIVFYTGSKPVFELAENCTRVTATGYWSWWRDSARRVGRWEPSHDAN